MTKKLVRQFLPLLAFVCFSGLLCGGNERLLAQSSSRPCGPDSIKGPLRLLIPQGAAGADFRSACRNHDACYDQLGSNRHQCDLQFRADMLCACESARNPRRCKRKANTMYKLVAKHGGEAFSSAQSIAASKAHN